MNGVMDYNWLGVAFVSDDLSQKTHKKVEAKMEQLRAQIDESFEKWLSENNLECAMGVIVKKGLLKE